MVEFDQIGRYIEEFFGMPADIRHIPQDARDIAEDFADAFKIPELTRPFEGFLVGVISHPRLQAVSFLVDVWGEDDSKPCAQVYCDFFLDTTVSELRANPELGKASLLHNSLNEVKGLLWARNDLITISYSNILTGRFGLETSLKGLVKRVYEKDPGLFNLDRVGDVPPSGFILALVDRAT